MERREFLKVAVFGALSASLSARALALAQDRAALPAGGLLDPLQPGQEIGLGWRLLQIHPPEGGAIRLLLGRGSGAELEGGRSSERESLATVDLVLRDGAPRGPAWTDHLDLMVMDGTPDEAGGQRAMPESLGRVLRRIAAVVQQNETALGAAIVEIGALSTYAERRIERDQDSHGRPA